MQTLSARISVLLVFLFVGTNVVYGGDGDKGCAEALAEITKRQVSQIKTCSAELNLSPKERKDKMNCVMKCILKKERLLNDEGMLDAESIKNMIEHEVPANLEHLREAGIAILNKCMADHGPNLDNKDEFCKSYAPLVKCLMGMMDLCKKA